MNSESSDGSYDLREKAQTFFTTFPRLHQSSWLHIKRFFWKTVMSSFPALLIKATNDLPVTTTNGQLSVFTLFDFSVARRDHSLPFNNDTHLASESSYSVALQTDSLATFPSLLCWLFHIFSTLKCYSNPVLYIYSYPWRNYIQTHVFKYHLNDDCCQFPISASEFSLLLNSSTWDSNRHLKFNVSTTRFLLFLKHTYPPLDFSIIVNCIFIHLIAKSKNYSIIPDTL